MVMPSPRSLTMARKISSTSSGAIVLQDTGPALLANERVKQAYLGI
jgi:hypothetical protein